VAIDVALILKLAPLAKRQLDTYRRSNPSRTLDRRVQAELESDPDLGPTNTDALLNEWLHVHNDPRGAVVIAGLLLHGDVAYLEALRIRATELLSGLETLPLGVPATVDRLVSAVANNFVAAQKADAEAVQVGTSAVLSAIDPLVRREDLANALERLQEMLTPPPPRVLLLASSFDEAQQRHLDALIQIDQSAAGRLAELLDARGIDGLTQTVRSPPGWATDQCADFWRTSGRILAEAGRLADAEQAFAREAERPDVEDRAAALIDAARCAEADRRSDGTSVADAYLAAAQETAADNPFVLLFVANRAEDPDERLALTDAVPVGQDRQVARRENQRAMALLALKRYEEAHAAAAASIAAVAEGGGRELATLTTILEAHSKLPLRDADDRPLMDAVAYQLSLHGEACNSGRKAMGGVAGARAALGTAVLGDRAAALELIDWIASDDELLVEQEARSALIEAALTIGDAERAQRLLPESDGTPESRLAHATVKLFSGVDRPTVAAELDALIEEAEPGDLRTQAVVMRLLAADDRSVSFDPSIAEGVRDGKRLLAHTQAARAMAASDYHSARAAVAQFDDPASLSLRSEIAEHDNALPEAIALQATLTRRQRTASNLLRLAALRARAGDFRGAIRDALRLATDDRKLLSAREHAYFLAAQAAVDGDEFEELEDITDRWSELSPDDEDPRWAHVFALARQDRHGEALASARVAGVEPTLDANRHLLWAELLMYGAANGTERMRSLMELSDRFGRPEELERAFIGGVLKTPSSDRGEDDAEVVARFQEAMVTFEERFPKSDAVKAIPVASEDDGAALIEKMAALQRGETQEQVDARQDALDGLRQGRVPVAFVAGIVGRGTVETVIRNGSHPLAVFDRPTAETELAAASQALDCAAASWDETACVTVAELPDDHARRIEALLPGSRIGQAVRDALADEVRGQMGGEQVAVMQILPDGTPRIVEENPETVTRVREVQTAANQVAGRLSTSPDRADVGDDKLATLLKDATLAKPLAAVVSALVTARSHGLPVFSDDRVVREYARAFGLPTFGTIALVDAAQQRGRLESEKAAEIVTAVLDLGVWGAALEPAAYVDVARRTGFDIDRCARPLLADEALMRADLRIVQNARLLGAIAAEAPDRLEQWASLAVNSYRELLDLDPLLVASLLVAAQLDPERSDVPEELREQNTRVVIALRHVEGVDPTVLESDPLAAGIGRWLHTVADPDQYQAVLENLLAQLEPDVASEMRRTLGAEHDE
jgi:predicted nucleic acid-binding protein